MGFSGVGKNLNNSVFSTFFRVCYEIEIEIDSDDRFPHGDVVNYLDGDASTMFWIKMVEKWITMNKVSRENYVTGCPHCPSHM